MIRLILLLALLLASPAAAQVPPAGGSATGTGYPSNSAPLAASATGTTGAISATLAAGVGQTTYICGFVISSGGTTTAVASNTTVTGTLGGSLNFTYVFVSTGQGVLGVAFPICVPGSAPNTAIVVNTPAGGAGTTVSVTAWGYRL